MGCSKFRLEDIPCMLKNLENSYIAIEVVLIQKENTSMSKRALVSLLRVSQRCSISIQLCIKTTP